MANRKLTDEERAKFNENRRRTCMERYGNPTYNNAKKCLETKQERYGDSHYNNTKKHKETCIERYGVEHHNQTEEARENIREKKRSKEVQEKYENTCLERYGCTNVNLSPEIMEKRKNTLVERYGVENPLQCEEIKQKQLDTMKRNGSYAKSKIEEEVYDRLLSLYQEEDIVRQYSDDRYPFNCDFYIKSKDVFIEVNNHPSHGGHPFNKDNEDDVRLLNELIENGDEWSMMIVDVWSIRDVKKFRVAKENNLDYRVIYEDIDEIVYE